MNTNLTEEDFTKATPEPQRPWWKNWGVFAVLSVLALMCYDKEPDNTSTQTTTTEKTVKSVKKTTGEFGMQPYTFSYTATGLIALNTTTNIAFGKTLPYVPINVLYRIGTPGLNLVIAITNITNTGISINNMAALPAGSIIVFTCMPPTNQ